MIRLLLTLTSFAVLANAQISGQFFIEKSSFAKGEPIFLLFGITNTGSQPINVYEADPYSFCSGYEIKILPSKAKTGDCEPWGIAGDCLSSQRSLKPGEQEVERLLLNFDRSNPENKKLNVCS